MITITFAAISFVVFFYGYTQTEISQQASLLVVDGTKQQQGSRIHLVDTAIQGETMNNQTQYYYSGDKIQTPFYISAKKIEKYTNTLKKDYDFKRGIKVFVNRDQKTYQRRNLYSKCMFTPAQENGPIPVLFIVNGRSGSSNTWQTLSKLAGGFQTEAIEAFGSNEIQIQKFFKSMTSEEEGSWWINEHLCEVTKFNSNSTIAGIQWKPYSNSWILPSAQGMLKQIASHNSDPQRIGHKIKVIYMTRNPLDVFISKQKHHSRSVPAHCSRSDVDCLEKHTESNLTLSVEDLVSYLKQSEAVEKSIENNLRIFGIDYYQTSYEKLYSSENTEEWMSILRYLERSPTQVLQFDDVKNSFPLIKTSSLSKESLLKNYNEVKNRLDGTKFAELLYLP